MKSALLGLAVLALTMAMVSAQADIFRQMMLMNALRGRGQSSGQGASSSSSGAGANPLSGLTSNPMGMMAMTGRMGDTMMDMMMCNMMPGHLRMMCMMRNV